jgi:hypothetical protein
MLRVAILLMLVSPAFADPKPPRIRIIGYAGHGWNCTKTECTRQPCDDCTASPKAWVVTYWDGSYYWVAKAAPTAGDCKTIKATLAKDADASECKQVGDVEPPAMAFDRRHVDPGDRWYCSEDDSCSRSKWDCSRAGNDKPCTAVDAAYVLISGNNPGKEGIAVHAYRTQKACDTDRHGMDPDRYELSACTRVGAIARAAIDPAALPKGRGWFCFQVPPNGWCWREANDCDQHHAFEHDTTTTACVETARAYVTQFGGDTSAFPTKAQCEASWETAPRSTRCELRP